MWFLLITCPFAATSSRTVHGTRNKGHIKRTAGKAKESSSKLFPMDHLTSKNMYVGGFFAEAVATLSGNTISKNSRRSGGMDWLPWAPALHFISSSLRSIPLFFFWHRFLVSANSAARAFCSADRVSAALFLSSPLLLLADGVLDACAGSGCGLHGWSAGKRCFRHVFLPQMLHTHGTSSSVLHPGQQHRNVTHVGGLRQPASMWRDTASSTLCPGLTSTALPQRGLCV